MADLVPRRASLAPRSSGLGLVPTFAGLGPEAEAYVRAAFSKNTHRAYNSDIAHFGAWCRRRGLSFLPCLPETLGDYLAEHGPTLKIATLRRRVAAIGRLHAIAGQDFAGARQLARTVLAGIAAQHGSAQKQAAALTTEEIRSLVRTCGEDLQGVRDRALLLLTYAGALRRSEVVALMRGDLKFTQHGLEVLIRRSKGDQGGRGQHVGIPRGEHPETCPIRALERWLTVAKIGPHQPVFRKVTRPRGSASQVVENGPLHPDSLRDILARRARRAGIVGTPEEPISPHGLRAGFVTQAYKAGAQDEAIMGHTRHKDLRTMRGYVRRARLAEDSPARKLGL